MSEITFCLSENLRTKQRIYADAEIMRKLPEIGDRFMFDYEVTGIYATRLDCRQDKNVWDYNIYTVDLRYDPDHNGGGYDIELDETVYIAIPIDYSEEENEQ